MYVSRSETDACFIKRILFICADTYTYIYTHACVGTHRSEADISLVKRVQILLLNATALMTDRSILFTFTLLASSVMGKQLVYVCIHTYMHTYIHTYINKYVNACMHKYINAYIHTCAQE